MGGKQFGFSDYELTTAKKQSKQEKFLAEMEVVVPWRALISLMDSNVPAAMAMSMGSSLAGGSSAICAAAAAIWLRSRPAWPAG